MKIYQETDQEYLARKVNELEKDNHILNHRKQKCQNFIDNIKDNIDELITWGDLKQSSMESLTNIVNEIEKFKLNFTEDN